MKKDEAEVRTNVLYVLRRGYGIRLPVRPIAFGTVLVRVAALCTLYVVRDEISGAVGPQSSSIRCGYQVGTYGTDMIEWLVQACLEVRTPQRLAGFNLDAKNGFNSLSRAAMRNFLLCTRLGSPDSQRMETLSVCHLRGSRSTFRRLRYGCTRTYR